MTERNRAVIATFLILLVGLAPALAQDPIDIDEIGGEGYVEAKEEMINGSSRPGRSLQLRNDLKNERYKIMVNTGSGDEEVTRVEFSVLAIGPAGGNNVNKIERQANGTLEFSVNGSILSHGCNPHNNPPGGCIGSGMPSEIYGYLISGGAIKAYSATYPNGIVVNKVKLRYDPETPE